MVRLRMSGLAVLLALGCSSGDEAPPPSPEPGEGPVDVVQEEERLTPEIAALGITNARRPSPNLLTGGQLTREQMTGLRELGYRTLINLRPADEQGTGWEEEYAAAEGIVFHRLPVPGAEQISRENAEELARLLEQAGDEPVAVYCGSGNRVGGLLALKAHFIDGLDADQAVAYGVKAGMTRLEPVVRSRMEVE